MNLIILIFLILNLLLGNYLSDLNEEKIKNLNLKLKTQKVLLNRAIRIEKQEALCKQRYAVLEHICRID